MNILLIYKDYFFSLKILDLSIKQSWKMEMDKSGGKLFLDFYWKLDMHVAGNYLIFYLTLVQVPSLRGCLIRQKYYINNSHRQLNVYLYYFNLSSYYLYIKHLGSFSQK